MTARKWERGPDGRIRRVSGGAPSTETVRETGLTAAGRPTRVPIARTIGGGLRNAWDYLGSTLALSVVWSLAAGLATMGGWGLGLALQGPRGVGLAGWLLLGSRSVTPGPGDIGWFVFGGIVALALWIFAVAPMTAAVFRFVRDIVAFEHPVWTEWPGYLRAHAGQAVRLGAVQALVTLVLITDLVYFAGQPSPALRVVAILFAYPLLFWLLAGQYQWPLLVEQRQGAWSTLRKSALLTLDNLALTLALGLGTALLTLVCLLTRVGFPLLWAGTLAFLHTQAARAVLRKYGVLPPEPEVEEEEA